MAKAVLPAAVGPIKQIIWRVDSAEHIVSLERTLEISTTYPPH